MYSKRVKYFEVNSLTVDLLIFCHYVLECDNQRIKKELSAINSTLFAFNPADNLKKNVAKYVLGRCLRCRKAFDNLREVKKSNAYKFMEVTNLTVTN